MALTLRQAKARATAAVAALGSDPAAVAALTSTFRTQGKVYEAWCLGTVLERLNKHERLDAVLVGGSKVVLTSAPGPINPELPHFELRRAGQPVADVWTNVEVASLSGVYHGMYAGSVHELDIVVVDHPARSHPSPPQLWLGVECEDTRYERRMLREVLGVRRELSYLSDPNPTRFDTWPQPTVPATPPCALVVYSTDTAVTKYQPAGDLFGIAFEHLSM